MLVVLIVITTARPNPSITNDNCQKEAIQMQKNCIQYVFKDFIKHGNEGTFQEAMDKCKMIESMEKKRCKSLL